MRGNKEHRRKGGQDEQISKTLSYVLRHSAVQEGLSIQPSGFIPLEQILQYLRKKFRNITQLQVRKIVDNNEKKRFQIEERKHHSFIRATQGHSMKIINTEELLTLIQDPNLYPVVIHGTFSKFLAPIKSQGLKRMTRNHIHFAPGMPKQQGVISGMRTSCNIIIQIDMALAIQDEIKFYISTNNVILTQGKQGVLSPKYFKRILQKKEALSLGKKIEHQKQQIYEKPQINKNSSLIQQKREQKIQ